MCLKRKKRLKIEKKKKKRKAKNRISPEGLASIGQQRENWIATASTFQIQDVMFVACSYLPNPHDIYERLTF